MKITTLHHLKTVLSPRTGFTLVEMLVTTGLVVLIMSLFVQIYGLAAGSITRQRAMGANDQKARVFSKLIHQDLQNMTFQRCRPEYSSGQGLVPISPVDASYVKSFNIVDPERQQGYFYLSENDPDNPTDDVLQFTTRVDPSKPNKQRYLGNVLELDDPQPDLGDYVLSGRRRDKQEQPAFDYPAGEENKAESRYAEVSYFLRGGNLCRRVLLLRERPNRQALPNNENLQPKFVYRDPSSPDPIYADRFRPNTDAGAVGTNRDHENYRGKDSDNNVFWNDFDFSATRDYFDPTDDIPEDGYSTFYFNTMASLAFDPQATRAQSLALPWNRFGHFNNQMRDPTTLELNFPLLQGMPREYDNQNGTNFLGRLTLEECSHANMHYPAREYSDGTNPSAHVFSRGLPPADPRALYDADKAVLENYRDGPRYAEDILLTNVEAFDVEVWDDTAFQFVQLGNTSTDPVLAGGEFHKSKRNLSLYGPRTAANSNLNNVFDTWHNNIKPSDMYCSDDPTAVPIDVSDPPTATADFYFPPYRPLSIKNDDLIAFVPANITNANVGRFFYLRPDGRDSSIVYQLVDELNSDPLLVANAPPARFTTIPDEVFEHGGYKWKCIDRRKGLKAIRLTIRYIDVQSRLPKQVTIVHSFQGNAVH